MRDAVVRLPLTRNRVDFPDAIIAMRRIHALAVFMLKTRLHPFQMFATKDAARILAPVHHVFAAFVLGATRCRLHIANFATIRKDDHRVQLSPFLILRFGERERGHAVTCSSSKRSCF
jgi:hypothetical protein